MNEGDLVESLEGHELVRVVRRKIDGKRWFIDLWLAPVDGGPIRFVAVPDDFDWRSTRLSMYVGRQNVGVMR